MGRKSAIVQLDPAIREAVDAAIREGRATLAQIVELIRSMGGTASVTSVHRYRRSAEQQMQRWRDAQEVAKVWIGRLETEKNGDVGRLLSEMLKTLAFQVAGEMGEGELQSAKDVMMLSAALRNVGAFDAVNLDRELKIRKEVAAQAAAAADKVVRKGGLSSEAAAELRRAILGVA